MTKNILLLIVTTFAAITPPASAKEQIFLGPVNSGASNGGADWLTGANGEGFTAVDFDDPPTGGFDFTISNTVAGKENNADWRCPPFSLGTAAGGARPINFSFAYKFPDKVAKGNNVHVQLRFFDSTGTNFISEIVLPIGANTGDSSMSDYKTRTLENIIVPQKARTADVWIDANIFEPWVSGIGRFGNFSVTTVPRSWLFKVGVILAALIGVGVLIGGGIAGVYSGIKRAKSARERAFVIRANIVCWVSALIFAFGMCLIPRSCKLLLVLIYVVGMTLVFLHLNKKQARIRSEESKFDA